MSKRNALITGGARGIGAACAKALAAEGYRVFINYVNSSEVANKLADEIIENGGEAFAVKADVRDPLQVEEMINNISQHGGVDALIANANMSVTSKPFLDQTWQE